MQHQPLHVIGAFRLEGVSKKTGNPYDISKIRALVPTEVGGPISAAVGLEVIEFDATPDVIKQLSSVAEFPSTVDAELRFNNRGGMSVVGVSV